MQEVCRSKPSFRRRLLFASVTFIFLLLADILVVAYLADRDLSQQVIQEAFRASLSAVRPMPAPLDGDDLQQGSTSSAQGVVPGLPSDLQSTGEGITNPQPRKRPPSIPKVFSSSRVRRQRVMTDPRGRVLWRGYQEGRSPREGSPRSLDRTTVPRPVREEWTVRDRPQRVITTDPPVATAPGEITEVGISEELLERELDQLERSLKTKLWIGAGIAALVLSIAFLYVLRLLHRTRLLEAQAQMDDRLAYVGALAAGLAHEIRNPLNVLSMNLQMLDEEITPLLTGGGGETRLYLSALQGEIRRLSTLVNNFLSYARPNQPRFERKDLNQILSATAQLVRPEFEAHGITLREQLSPFLPQVDLDESLIRQAVMNILMNATHVLKSGGTVTVTTAVGSQGEVIATIQDDGPGIKGEDKERVFDVFYSSRGGGTGLGLPIAARIMEAHGGTIAVESEPGEGARFILELPRRHIGAGGQSGAGAVAASGRS